MQRSSLDSEETGAGFFNNLRSLFGAGAFEVMGGGRFIHYIEAGSPRAASFVAPWAAMRAELGDGVHATTRSTWGWLSTPPRWRD